MENIFLNSLLTVKNWIKRKPPVHNTSTADMSRSPGGKVLHSRRLRSSCEASQLIHCDGQVARLVSDGTYDGTRTDDIIETAFFIHRLIVKYDRLTSVIVARR